MNASAFVVGSEAGRGSDTLAELATSLGFASVAAYAGRSDAERQSRSTPLVFFLCAAVPDLQTLQPTADAIRQSRSSSIRFAPLIYFAHNPAVATIKACIRMGFDDVIALPCDANAIRDRVLRQVGHRQVYYETSSYFGPDRRDRTGAERRSDGLADEFRRYEIVRTAETGIDVLDDGFQVVV